MFRICGPRTLHAGHAPAAPCPAAVAMFASPSGCRARAARRTAASAPGCDPAGAVGLGEDRVDRDQDQDQDAEQSDVAPVVRPAAATGRRWTGSSCSAAARAAGRAAASGSGSSGGLIARLRPGRPRAVAARSARAGARAARGVAADAPVRRSRAPPGSATSTPSSETLRSIRVTSPKSRSIWISDSASTPKPAIAVTPEAATAAPVRL